MIQRRAIWGDVPIAAPPPAVGKDPIARKAILTNPSTMQTRTRSVPSEKPVLTRDQVAEMAYQILLSQRYQEGHHIDLWREAEAQLLSGPSPNRRAL
jgi:hypothetical protein